MKKYFLLLMFVCLLLSPIHNASADWIPWGTTTGGIGVYYNTSTEQPANQAYFKAQYNNSTSLLNGAGYSFDSSVAGIFGDQGQFGFDLVVAAPTSLISMPSLPAYDNTNNTLAGRAFAGNVMWAINDYKDGTGGPGNAANGTVNSLIRGNTGSVMFFNYAPLAAADGWQVDIIGFLESDDVFHWYNPACTDAAMINYAQGDVYLTGRFKYEATLTYLRNNDSTSGMDFYSGTGKLYAETAVPEPGTLMLLGFGLIGLAGLVRCRK